MVSYKTFIACYKEDIVKFVALIAVVAVVVVLFHCTGGFCPVRPRAARSFYFPGNAGPAKRCTFSARGI